MCSRVVKLVDMCVPSPRAAEAPSRRGFKPRRRRPPVARGSGDRLTRSNTTREGLSSPGDRFATNLLALPAFFFPPDFASISPRRLVDSLGRQQTLESIPRDLPDRNMAGVGMKHAELPSTAWLLPVADTGSSVAAIVSQRARDIHILHTPLRVIMSF